MTTISKVPGRGIVVTGVSTRDNGRRPRKTADEMHAEETAALRSISDRLTKIEDARRSRATRDELLEAVEPGKLLALGQVWDGISERLDDMVSELRDLETGLTTGNSLRPEDIANYAGLNRARGALTDFQVAVRDAKARIAARTGDRRTTDGWLERARRRDRAANRITNTLNRQNAARISGRTMDSADPGVTPPSGRPMTIREINAANRANADRYTEGQMRVADGGGHWPPEAA